MSNDSYELVSSTIEVDGTSDPISFSSLNINQLLADTCSFFFVWRQDERAFSFSDMATFFEKNLSKDVTIVIGHGYTFKGIITAINCIKQDRIGVEYAITGKGLFEKLDRVEQCNTFAKKTIKQIFNTLNNAQGTDLTANPENSSQLFYTVQYNQSTFNFYKMLAGRHGEWLHYNGKQLKLEKPGGDAIKLKNGEDVHNVKFMARNAYPITKIIGFDQHKGEKINAEPKTNPSDRLLKTSMKSGEKAYGVDHTGLHIPSLHTHEIMNTTATMLRKAAAASTVVVSGESHNSNLNLCTKIKIEDADGNDAGEYIITEINHRCNSENHYYNQFLAVPAQVEVPPYTERAFAHAYPVIKRQPAIVIDNEDKDGLDRVKVRFPWQQDSETTPWLSVLVPHAGKGKGFRFVPEKDEEVMIDFVDGNAEKPFVAGSVFTEKHKSGNSHGGNDHKGLSTRSGNSIVLNDKSGSVTIIDKGGNTISIDGSGNINIKSDAKINIDTKEINLNASQKINLAGKIVVDVAGNKVTINANDVSIEGTTTTVKGKTSLGLNSDTSVSSEAPNIDISGKASLNLGATNVNIDGKAMTNVKGGLLNLN